MSSATIVREYEIPSPDVAVGAETALAELVGLRSSFDTSAPGELVALHLELPTFAARLLVDALTALAEGHAVTVVPVPAELTTQGAADILNVSRPYLIKLLDERKLPYRRVGNRRKVLLEDVLRYKQRDDKFRQAILDDLSREAQAIGLEALTADQFLVHLVGLHPAIVATTLQRQTDALDNPPQRIDELLDKLELNGLTRTAAEVRRYLQP